MALVLRKPGLCVTAHCPAPWPSRCANCRTPLRHPRGDRAMTKILAVLVHGLEAGLVAAELVL